MCCAEYFQVQEGSRELAQELRHCSFPFPQADSQADRAGVSVQRLLWVPVAFPVCSAGRAGCAALSGQSPGCAGVRAGPGTAVLCPCRAGDSRALDTRPER